MKKFKGILTGFVFFLLLFVLLAGFSHLLEYKEGKAKTVPLLERAGQVDVLFLGDSHAYSDIYPFELWDRYGITAYNMANYNCTIPMSYWLLRNALTTCHPKAVVIDVNLVWEPLKLPINSSDAHLGLDGFPLSRTKLDAIFDLMDDPSIIDSNGSAYTDLIPEFIFPFIKYHARWSSLTADSLHPVYNQDLGAQRNLSLAAPASYEIVSDAAQEQGYGFIYLRRLIEFCQGKGIQVLLINLPYPSRNENDEQLYTNAVQYLADEYGIDYIDFVYLDQFVDYSTDCYDPDSHLNPSGAYKVTHFLGQHLRDAYGVPDHRNDSAYTRWNADYAIYRQNKLRSLLEMQDPRIFLMLLADPSFSTVLLLPEDSAVRRNALNVQLVQNIARRYLMPSDMYEAVWSDSLMPLEHSMQPTACMVYIDRTGPVPSVAELPDTGTIPAPFGSISFDKSAGTAAVKGSKGSTALKIPPDCDLAAAVLDRDTGEVLYQRALHFSADQEPPVSEL